MMITLFCDASYCGQTGSAGWGAWAKGDGWPSGKVFGGPLPRGLASSAHAELAAIAAALRQLTDDGDLTQFDSIMIQSDSLAALAAVSTGTKTIWSNSSDKRDSRINEKRRVLSHREHELVSTTTELINCRTVFLRHVRGHVSGTTRNWINRSCDKTARYHMRRMRAEVVSEPAAC